ncbi:hypothetical protein SynBIOSE41_02672 [Synechococcus sp. BIOS-E4-1]|nr:hypothetical protein SynBIOSE41_02672 [Synechococcus sp. BIOS-E4-1]
MSTVKSTEQYTKGVACTQNLLLLSTAATGDVDGGRPLALLSSTSRHAFVKGQLVSCHQFTTPGPQLDAVALAEDCNSEKQPQ